MACIYQPLPEMTVWDIKALIGKRGSSPAKVARELGRSKSHVSKVLHGERQSRRVEEALAAAAGLTHKQFLRLRKKAA